RSMVSLMLKVALGGLMSIPIATLILWWGMGRDPFGFAERLPDAVAFLAPSKLRNSSSTSGARPLPGTTTPQTNDSDFGNALRTAQDHAVTGADDTVEDAVATPDDLLLDNDASDTGGVTAAEYGPVNTWNYHRNDLGAALTGTAATFESFQNAYQAWQSDNANVANKKRAGELIKTLYQGLCDLSHKVTFIGPDNSPETDETVAAAVQFIGDSVTQSFVPMVSASANLHGTLSEGGIFLVGVPRQMQTTGDLVSIQLQLGKPQSGKPYVYQLVVTPDVAQTISIGEPVAVTGTLVPSPTIDLTGYDGPDTAVVWSRYVIPILLPKR
ncbi:MAG: hypothetical protein KDA60_12250, partial [Planctomycetales bacterium]|nr:hypothetical protein [Planctomycetales bacterium]